MKIEVSRWFCGSLAIIFSMLSVIPSLAADTGATYAGLEFLGSSLVSRVELEKTLRLKPGASFETTDKAVDRLKLELDKKSIKANVELIPDNGSLYVAVDVVETGFNNTNTNRKLENPHHIGTPNEKPFELLEELKERLAKLSDEGRPSAETYEQGIRCFTDVASGRIAELIIKEIQGETPYMMQILAHDPNGLRRAEAAELLNWTPSSVRNCFDLIPALDDSDARVRMATAKYIWARVNLLPDDFPFDALLEGLSRQLTRPTHHDRVRAMAALLALAKRDSDSITGIKTFDETKLKEIADNSVIPSVQNIAKQLLQISANPPPIQRKSKGQGSDDNSAGF